jgi:hypothetical protein
MTELKYKVDPALSARSTCSSSTPITSELQHGTMRGIGSSHVDPYRVAGAAAALAHAPSRRRQRGRPAC